MILRITGKWAKVHGTNAQTPKRGLKNRWESNLLRFISMYLK